MPETTEHNCPLCGDPSHTPLYCPEGKAYQTATRIFERQQSLVSREHAASAKMGMPPDLSLDEEIRNTIAGIKKHIEYLREPKAPTAERTERDAEDEGYDGDEEEEAPETDRRDLSDYYPDFTPEELQAVIEILEQKLQNVT